MSGDEVEVPEVRDTHGMALPGKTGKLAEGKAVHEKAERKFDKNAFLTMTIAGFLCGLMMWIAFSYVAGEVDVKSLVGALFGGVLSGWAMFALS
jgi:hypothetical protein